MTSTDNSNIKVKDLSFINDIKSAAVIGPSKRRDYFFLKSHQENFQGPLYAITPTTKEIPGFDDGTQGKIYSSLKDVPGEVDFVFIAVPQSQILDVMNDCAEKGVKLASVFTAEFSDSGTEEGRELERELLKRAQGKVRILGPNGMGMSCPKLGIAWRPKFPKTPGNIGLIAQSGGMCNIATYMSMSLGINFSKIFSFGNGADIDLVDILYYLSNDPETEIIMIYVEGIKEGRGKELRKILAQNKKPIIILRGGRTESGAIAAKTHTAAISGKGEIWKGIIEQYNLIEVESLEQLLYAAKLIEFYGLFSIQNVAVLSISGGYGVIIVDLLEKHGINVPPSFSSGVQEQIKSQFFTKGTSPKNPLDISAQLFASDSVKRIIDLALSDKEIDGLIMDLPSWYFSQDYHIRKNSTFERAMIKCFFFGKKHGKPLIPILQRVNCPEDRARVVKKLTEGKVPVFGDPLEFIPLLSKISKYSRKALNT